MGKLKEPFTEAQFERIKQDFPIEVIENTLRSMHNYRELLKKYVSANLTFRKWAKKDMEDGKYRKTTGGGTAAGGNSNVSDDYKRNILERILGSGGTVACRAVNSYPAVFSANTPALIEIEQAYGYDCLQAYLRDGLLICVSL